MDSHINAYKSSGAAGVNGAVLEDTIMRKGWPATAGSKILDAFVSPFDATVVTRLLDNGIGIAGRAGMNEFGLPQIVSREAGDICEAVDAVAAGAAPFALCNDIFGIYRRRAAEAGVCYLHPTYGTVSRYGLIPLACSMDQIGIVCKHPADGFNILSVIAGNDPKEY